MRKIELTVDYQNTIPKPPETPEALFQRACTNDQSTIDHWEHTWLGNITANKQRFGSFKDHSAGSEFQKYRYLPAVVAGAGPSLKVNAHELKNRGKIPLISCLHNFHFFEDLDLAPEYYVTLDAGPVTIEEVTEGGKRPEAEYWERTKERTLVAYIGTHPDLLAKWQGKILFFNAPVPRQRFIEKVNEIERFNVIMSSGGNVLGACLYFAKAVLGCFTTIFIGADFSFGYDKKFHAWDSKYDAAMGHVQYATTIHGVKVPTWPSYYNFKAYFDSVALRIPGIYYNCTEGGCLGAYPEGNIEAFRYMDLKDCLKHLNLNEALQENMQDPSIEKQLMLY